MRAEPNVPREPRKRRPLGVDGAALGLGLIFGVLGLWVVYLVVFFSAGPPNGHIGPYAFIPIGIYAAVAIYLTVRKRGTSMSVGGGMLLGLGIWLLIGGGACIGSLSRTAGLS